MGVYAEYNDLPDVTDLSRPDTSHGSVICKLVEDQAAWSGRAGHTGECVK